MYLNHGFMSNNSEVDSKPSSELLFSKPLLVAINERGSSISRSTKLHVTVERTSNLSALRKELVVRLTDEYDPFFIYVLNLNEEDYQQLKEQQGLLIDFPSFPQKFIGLLELAIKEENKETPKFLLNLKTTGVLGCENNVINLDIIETNPFKHLTHLSLKLSPASDAFVKKFLASTLKSFKDEKERLENSLKAAQSEYQNHLHHCQENLSTRNQEFDRLRQSLQNEISSLSRRYSEELRSEQDKFLQAQKEAELSREKLKRDIEVNHNREKESLEEKVKRLELQNNDLQSKLINAESQTRDIRSHFVNSEDELFQLRQKNVTLTKENKSLDAQFHEHLKTIGNLKSQLAATTQELRDKELIFIKTQELLKTTQDQKKQLEELLDQKQALVVRRESALRTVSDDLNKGNEIIKKLQNEIRSYHSKLKIHGDVACKQEEVILEKEKRMASLEKDLKSRENLLEQKESELVDLRKELMLIQEKFEEAQKHNKTNENVIAWLNKQLNENGIQKRGFVSGVNDPLQNVSSIPFRPTAMTSTPSVPQSVFYQTRLPTHSGSPLFSSNGPLNTNPSYFQTRVPFCSESSPDHNIRNVLEPDPISPPTATTTSNTAVKQISTKTLRSSLPSQNRSSRTTVTKTPPIPNKSK